MRQDKSDQLAPETFTKLGYIVEPGCQARPAVMPVKTIQTGVAQLLAVDVNCPAKRMLYVPFNPRLGIAELVWRKAKRVTPKAAHNLWCASKSQAPGNIGMTERAKMNAVAIKNGDILLHT